MHAGLQTSGEQVEHAWGGVVETGEGGGGGGAFAVELEGGGGGGGGGGGERSSEADSTRPTAAYHWVPRGICGSPLFSSAERVFSQIERAARHSQPGVPSQALCARASRLERRSLSLFFFFLGSRFFCRSCTAAQGVIAGPQVPPEKSNTHWRERRQERRRRSQRGTGGSWAREVPRRGATPRRIRATQRGIPRNDIRGARITPEEDSRARAPGEAVRRELFIFGKQLVKSSTF